MYLADFHIHSNFSDGKLSIPEIVDLFGSQGFGAIAITDHLCDEDGFLGKSSRLLGASLTKATFPLYQEILKSEALRAWDQYQMRLIPGMELTRNNPSNYRSSHIIALGVTDWLRADEEVTTLINQIHEKGGVAIAAHPVWTRKLEKQTFYLWDRREELKDHFDAWEVASGPYLFGEVQRSGLPVVASSDMHRPTQMTSWKTLMRVEKKTESIFEAIRSQELDLHFYEEKKNVNPVRRSSFHLGVWPSFNVLGNLALR